MRVKTSGYSEDIPCDSINEGENGLFLKDEDDQTIGYVPYDNLVQVIPDSFEE